MLVTRSRSCWMKSGEISIKWKKGMDKI
jgi:hypothetical protein